MKEIINWWNCLSTDDKGITICITLIIVLLCILPFTKGDGYSTPPGKTWDLL